jgi:hypothetical protein
MKRRAIREALGHLFTLRERREATHGANQYHQLADNCSDGHITEALIVLRAALVHQVIKPVALEFRDAYSDTYSDNYDSLVWLERSEMSEPRNTLGVNYDKAVGGKDVAVLQGVVRQVVVSGHRR